MKLFVCVKNIKSKPIKNSHTNDTGKHNNEKNKSAGDNQQIINHCVGLGHSATYSVIFIEINSNHSVYIYVCMYVLLEAK